MDVAEAHGGDAGLVRGPEEGRRGQEGVGGGGRLSEVVDAAVCGQDVAKPHGRDIGLVRGQGDKRRRAGGCWGEDLTLDWYET